MKRLLGMVVVMGLVVAACGGGDDVSIDDPWARASANMQNAGAVYMTISGGEAGDALTGVSVDSSVAAVAELHESSMDSSGQMSMQQVQSIAVPADGSVSLEPGSYHVMLMQLADPLEDGDEFSVTLTFENAGEVEVDVEVRDE